MYITTIQTYYQNQINKLAGINKRSLNSLKLGIQGLLLALLSFVPSFACGMSLSEKLLNVLGYSMALRQTASITGLLCSIASMAILIYVAQKKSFKVLLGSIAGVGLVMGILFYASIH